MLNCSGFQLESINAARNSFTNLTQFIRKDEHTVFEIKFANKEVETRESDAASV